MIERIFSPIPEGKIEEADEQSILLRLGFGLPSGMTWEALLQSKRVLLVSEAGSGKTYECRNQCERLWDSGEAAFFLELADLAKNDFFAGFSLEETERFNQWLASQSEVATFFLDSIDELKLSLGSFERALKCLAKAIHSRLNRARIIITSRPIPFDEDLARRLLPVPSPTVEIEPSGETFAQIILQGSQQKKPNEEDKKPPPVWRLVTLLPFSNEQIVEFARLQGVDDPEQMLNDLIRRNAQEFARRPQDLIELSADWRDSKRVRSHREQVEANVRIKLKPRDDRPEPAELSVEKAIDGASRLALAMTMTRRLTIRHSAEFDCGRTEPAFDPALILMDWTSAERKALLERALFSSASYGRVRFHHRSVMEFLAAKRLLSLRKKRMSASALKRLLFMQTRGKTIVRRSKRAIAGWLALEERSVFEMLRDNEPDVLFNEGDPASLTIPQRIRGLRAFVERHGKGGWRGVSAPSIQLHRFASRDLGGEINRLWNQGIENREIRQILLQLIELGSIAECSAIAYGCASDPQLKFGEHLAGIDALRSLSDSRLPALVEQIANSSSDWSERRTRAAIMRLFPQHMSITQLFKILPRLNAGKRSIESLGWDLTRLISEAEWKAEELEAIRAGLTLLISEDLRWQGVWPRVYSSKSRFVSLLAATCAKGLLSEVRTEWLQSGALALLLDDHDDQNRDVIFKLAEILNNLTAEHIRTLFWETDVLIQRLHPIKDPWDRFYETTIDWKIQLKYDRDIEWISEDLSDANRTEEERAMVLEAAACLKPPVGEWADHMVRLKSLVTDVPSLEVRIDAQIERSKKKSGPQKWEIEQAKWKKVADDRKARDLASWERFWKNVCQDPETAFSDEKRDHTAWNLWRAMCKVGSRSRRSGWNRQFIEDYLGKDVADRLRLALMRLWRADRPTLRSERPANEKGTYMVKWELGLAGIYAESEDTSWATRLSNHEAELATRYATIDFNGLPAWMEALVKAHPTVVDEILGEELIAELDDKTEKHGYSMLLQDIDHSADLVVAIFLPRIRVWLDTNLPQLSETENVNREVERFSQVTEFLARHGDEDTRTHLSTIARKQLMKEAADPFSSICLSLLFNHDPESGVDALERQVQAISPSPKSEAVILIGKFFRDRSGDINISERQFTPTLLLRLMRLLYRHVRPEDDSHHDGVYCPDERDEAEQARNKIVAVLLASKGEGGWAAKLEMAADPLCAYFKDRILAAADESWAEEVDSTAFSNEQAIVLDKSAEAPPMTNETLFTLMVDRLEDIDDLLLQDISPRESWANITEERVMRREIARELHHLANDQYKIDQEAVTADEKETDIRLRSTASAHEAIIEVKLADNRTTENLLATLEDQLVKKYMASGISRSGCLLVTIGKERKWSNPNGGPKLNFSELIHLLRTEAENVMKKHHNSFRLHVHAFDLNSRLPTEATKKASKGQSEPELV